LQRNPAKVLVRLAEIVDEMKAAVGQVARFRWVRHVSSAVTIPLAGRASPGQDPFASAGPGR
jgi:hypothetical protein